MYKCPRCGSSMLDYKNEVECVKCHLTFRKQSLEDLDADDILAEEEKKAFLDAFLDD